VVQTIYKAKMQDNAFFEFLSFETLISKHKNEYYKALSHSDNVGKSTKFIEYMLQIIDKSLDELLSNALKKLLEVYRLQFFLDQNRSEFSRKDYNNYLKEISSTTASRDLKYAV
jgi:Fic family protein